MPCTNFTFCVRLEGVVGVGGCASCDLAVGGVTLLVVIAAGVSDCSAGLLLLLTTANVVGATSAAVTGAVVATGPPMAMGRNGGMSSLMAGAG